VVTPRGLIGRGGAGDEVSSGECKVVYGKVCMEGRVVGWGMRVFSGMKLWLSCGW
jgi:hypothetical protein